MMNENLWECEYDMSVRELERVLIQIYRRIGVQEIREIPSTAEYAVSIVGKTAPLSPLLFELQIYIWNKGKKRVMMEIEAIGDGIITFVETSVKKQRGVYRQLTAGKKKMRMLIQALREYES